MTNYRYRLLGTGTTNSQGIATLQNGYTGVGAGKIDIVACDSNDPSDESAIVSPVKELLDCLYYDKATDTERNDTMWSSVSGFNRTQTDTYIAPSSGYARSFAITNDICIEIDVKIDPQNVDTTSNSFQNHGLFAIDHVNNFKTMISEMNIVMNTWQHLKFTIIEGAVVFTNETNPATKPGTVSNPSRFLLRVFPNIIFYFKELKVYPI